jgi:hypothetical protein
MKEMFCTQRKIDNELMEREQVKNTMEPGAAPASVSINLPIAEVQPSTSGQKTSKMEIIKKIRTKLAL